MRLQLYKIISKKRAASKSHIERLTEAVFELLRLKKKKKKEAKRKQKKRAVDNEKNIVSFYHLVLSFFRLLSGNQTYTYLDLEA